MSTTTNEELNQKLDVILAHLKLHDKQFEQIDKRFEQVDQRFEQVDQRFEQVDKRFDQVDQRFEQIDKRFDQVDKRLDQADNKFESIENQLRDIRLEMRDMKIDIRRDGEKLEKVYETRHEVEYKIGRDFILKNLGWNMTIIVIGLILGKLIILG